MEKKKGLSFRQFAKLIGVSAPTVTNYIRDQLIPQSALISNGKRKRINPAAAMEALAANLDPYRRKRGRAPASQKLIDAKTKSARWHAKTIKLRYEKRRAKYEKKSEIRRDLKIAEAIIREHGLALAGKLAPLLVKEKDEIKVLKIMHDETRKCLIQIANDLDKAKKD